MFEANKSVADQRCAPPGARLGVKFELNKDGQLEVAKGSGEPVDRAELDVMLSGGHRNRITQPVSAFDNILTNERSRLQMSQGQSI